MSDTNDATREELIAQRDDLIGQADELLTRNQDGLAGDDRTTFEQIEQRLNLVNARIEMRDRQAAQDAGFERFSGALDSDTATAAHQLPPIRFADEQLRSAFDDFLGGHQGTAVGELETRASIALPVAQSTIPTYDTSAIPKRIEPTRIAELLMQRPINSRSVIFYQETTGSTSAATVLEGATKPESAPGWTAVTTSARKVAHFTNMSKESLDDFDGFAEMVHGSMLRGLISAENQQLINGDGVDPNILGLLSTSGILTYAPGSPEARFLSILHAQEVLRVGAAFAEPDVVVLHPADYEILAKTNASSAGIHLADQMVGSPARSIWGLRVVLTSQISSGTALVLDSTAAVVFSREPVTVIIDPYSGSMANMVKVIMEERIGLGVLQPSAVLKLTFNGTT